MHVRSRKGGVLAGAQVGDEKAVGREVHAPDDVVRRAVQRLEDFPFF